MEKYHAEENKVLSFFELNLETWRQLWRVLEISDIVLVIVDIRYPVIIIKFKCNFGLNWVNFVSIHRRLCSHRIFSIT